MDIKLRCQRIVCEIPNDYKIETKNLYMLSFCVSPSFNKSIISASESLCSRFINNAVVSFVLSDDSNVCCLKMIYQVLINFNEKRNKPLEVADSEEKFNKTTVLELKQKFKEKIAPGAPDAESIRVVFGKDALEDNMTLVNYKVKHLSVIFLVLKMPGGDVCPSKAGP